MNSEGLYNYFIKQVSEKLRNRYIIIFSSTKFYKSFMSAVWEINVAIKRLNAEKNHK